MAYPMNRPDRTVHRLALLPAVLILAVTAALLYWTPAHAQAGVDAFDPAPDGQVFSIALQPDGKILIGGEFDQIGGQSRSALARLAPDGTPDGFAPAFDNLVSSIVVQPDGAILVGGNFTQIDGTARAHLARLSATGALDANFAPVLNERVYSILRRPDGVILVGGVFDTADGASRPHLAQFAGDGTLDTGFAPEFNDYVAALALQPDGKILVGGAFTKVDGKNRGRLARLNADGSLDETFTPGANNDVYTIAVQADGKILVGGRFSKIDAANTGSLVRLNADGSLDGTFTTVVEGGAVVGMALDAAGRMVIGGEFTQVNGTNQARFARLNADGSLDSDVNLPADGYASALTIQPDGAILVGGAFGEIGGAARDHLARISGTGPASATLSIAPLGDAVTWTRGGSAPALSTVAFDVAVAAGPFVPLGQATRSPGGWTLADIALPVNQPLTVRARGVHYTNVYGAGSLIEADTQAQISAASLEARTVTVPPSRPSAWTLTADGPTPLTTVLTGTATSGVRALATGAYTMTLTPVDAVNTLPYTTTHACTVNGAPGPSGDGRTVALTLATGDAAVCTWTNTAPVTQVTFVKNVESGPFGSAQPEDWTFTVDGRTVAPGATLDLIAGDYAVTETGPVGYAPTTASGACVLGNDGVTLSVPADAAAGVTCAITNTVQDTGTTINLLEAYGVSSLVEGVTVGEGSQSCHWITTNIAPTSPVTVTVTPDDLLAVTPLTVVLDGDNWDNTAASDPSNLICVTAMDDEIDHSDVDVCKTRTVDPLGGPASDAQSCGDHVVFLAHRVVAAADTRFFDGIPFTSNGLADLDGDARTVDVLLTENDAAGITVTPPETTRLREGESTRYTLRLATEPRASVVISATANAFLTATPDRIVVDATNWRTPVTVTVTAVQDFVDTGSEVNMGAIVHTVGSRDANYAALQPAGVTVEVENIDRAAMLFTRDTLTIAPGASVRYGLILTSKPRAPVVVVITPSSGLTVDAVCPMDGIRYCLVVTPETWDTLQLVTAGSDGSPGSIRHSLRSDDPDYDQLAAAIPVNQGGTYTIHMPMIRKD